jgi:hypothetical protein
MGDGSLTVDHNAKNSKPDLEKYESENRPRSLFLDANDGHQAETNPTVNLWAALDKLAKRHQ